MTREFKIRRDLRSGDYDIYRHLNQAIYHQLLEDGRVMYLDHLGLGDCDRVVARVELDHRQEIPLGETEVTVEMSVGRVGNSSFVLHNLVRRSDGEIAAEGDVVLVAWDGERRSSRPLGEAEKETLLRAASVPAGQAVDADPER